MGGAVGPVLAVLVGAVTCAVIGKASLRVPGPIARPVEDRWHHRSTPVTGGFALLAGFLLALSVWSTGRVADRRLWVVAVAAAAAFALGLGDDERVIGPRAKFAGQIAIAALTAAYIHPAWLPGAASYVFACFLLVGAMNSFNFLDNIDGLAAGTALIAAGTLALTSLFVVEPGPVAPLSLGIVAATVGFLPLNYRRGRPAALFMGDSGAHMLGLVVGAAALLSSPNGVGGVSAAVVAPLLILALPILDTSLVILVRLAERRPIWRGGRDHLSHRLVYAGLGEHEAVLALLALAAACAGAGLLVDAVDDPLVTGMAAGVVFALLVGIGSRLAIVREAASVTPLPVPVETPALDPVHEHAQAN